MKVYKYKDQQEMKCYYNKKKNEIIIVILINSYDKHSVHHWM